MVQTHPPDHSFHPVIRDLWFLSHSDVDEIDAEESSTGSRGLSPCVPQVNDRTGTYGVFPVTRGRPSGTRRSSHCCSGMLASSYK